MSRFLGIDYGSKKVGIAISSKEGGFAFPYAILKNTTNLVSQICAICEKEKIQIIVIGESLNYKNEPNPVMEDIVVLKNNIEKECGIRVIFQKETLTTKEAERIQGRKKDIDASAAALILKSYLKRTNG